MSADLEELQRLVGNANLIEAFEVVRHMQPNWADRHGTDDIRAVRFHCLAAEVFDHVGKYEEASLHARSVGPRCKSDLEKLSEPPGPGERSLWKQRAWAVLQLGFADFYRRGALAEALALFRLVEAKLELLYAPDYPCWGLRARVAYAIGLVHRQRREYFEAICAFGNAVERSLRHVAVSQKSRGFYELSAARALALGLGWVHYTLGSLSTAKALVQSARWLLSGKNEHFISAYVDVIHACILMAAHTTEAAVIRDATWVLREAYTLFEKNQHAAYRARAANELSLAYIRQARNLPEDAKPLLRKAQKYAFEVAKYGRRKKQTRWLCNAYVAFSRIFRERRACELAIKAGNRALALASHHHIRFCQIDAGIALGEALIERSGDEGGDLERAQAILEEALKTSLDENAKVKSVIHLHLTRCNLRMHRVGRAIWHFERARQAGEENENAFVRDLQDRVAQELSVASADFVVPFDMGEKTDPQGELIRFHGWLTIWALAKVTRNGDETRNTVGHAAALLDISERQFHRWRKQAGLPPVDHRRGHARSQAHAG